MYGDELLCLYNSVIIVNAEELNIFRLPNEARLFWELTVYRRILSILLCLVLFVSNKGTFEMNSGVNVFSKIFQTEKYLKRKKCRP